MAARIESFLAIKFSHEAKKLLASIDLISFRKTLWWTPTCYTKDEGDCVMHTEKAKENPGEYGTSRLCSYILWDGAVFV
jgi:hypothetical protein